MAFQPIRVFADRCTGCRACEAVCVFRRHGVLGTATARIRIRKNEAEGLDEPLVCRLCAEPACIPSCPEGALCRDERTGAVALVEGRCTSCGACAEACPYGSISLDPANGKPLICDLCGGDPACVPRCSSGALEAGREAEGR